MDSKTALFAGIAVLLSTACTDGHGGGGGEDGARTDASQGVPDGGSGPGSPDAGEDPEGGTPEAGPPCLADTASDAKNCGACGHDCLGGTCVAGRCEAITLVSGEHNPTALAVEGSFVYWTTAGTPKGSWVDGTLNRAPTTGGPKTILSSKLRATTALALSPNAFWITSLGVTGVNGYLARIPRTGGAPTYLYNDINQTEVIADSAHVFWTNQNVAREVQRLPENGKGSPTIVAYGSNGVGLTQDASNLFFPLITQPPSLRVEIFRVPKGGSASSAVKIGDIPLSNEDGDVTAMAADASSIYFCDYAGVVGRMNRSTGAVTTLANVGTACESTTLVVDDDWVYWATFSSIYKVAKTGGPPIELAALQQDVRQLAIDDDAIYWVIYGDSPTADYDHVGEIRKLAK